ncbi:MAG: molybdopterin-dependent oxidoreductase [Oleiphilaceae bacterium]|nr:molybdopterin-dependent oxidoreductase [Oleiphilaceae bacterium]
MAKVRTTCAYCGVGCGITADVDDATRVVTVQGDKAHPSNVGRLCSKGSSLGETLSLQSRLLQPQVHDQNTSWNEALDFVAERFTDIIAKHGKDAVAFYGSGQLLTEDYYIANKLMKGFIGSANIDTNSRLCMSSAVAGHKRAFGSDTVAACYDDLDHAELIVLVGSNTAWCHPIVFQRIRAAKDANPNMKVVVIDPRRTATCDIADLHLPLESGADVALFNGLLAYLAQHDCLDEAFINAATEGFADCLDAAQQDASNTEQVAARCGLKQSDIETFFAWYAGHDQVMTLYSQGVKQSSSGVDKVNAILNCHLATGRIGKPGAGPLSLTGQPNAMGGREVGGLANQLAAHMNIEDPVHRDRVGRFWSSDVIPDAPGLAAVDMFDAIAEGRIKAVWIMATNPVVSLPNADKVKQALKDCELVVVSDCVANSDTLDLAHVKLPAQGWSEKDGMVTNSERFITRQRALLPPAGEAKPDWWILCEVAKRMGFADAFSYDHHSEIFAEHAALSGFENDTEHGLRDFDISALSTISVADYDAFEPTQWPINAEYPKGRKRFFDDGQFFTPSGKARFCAVRHRLPANLPDNTYPLVLNTGRLRDQWHTMTRSALAPRLNQHRPEPFVEVHPEDALKYQLQDGALAHLRSHWGQMYARVRVTEQQRQGMVFVPMHWSEQYAKKGRMGALVNPVVDPISGQPESKHTPVAIRPLKAGWYGFVLAREASTFETDYSVKVNAEHHYRYELAGVAPLEPQQLVMQLDPEQAFTWQTYRDEKGGVFRAAGFSNGRLQCVVCMAPEYDVSVLPDRQWIGKLFAEEELDEATRLQLLSGVAPSGSDCGATICACYSVGERTIEELVFSGGLSDYQAVGAACKAGTNCGSCIPEIKQIIARVKPAKSA